MRPQCRIEVDDLTPDDVEAMIRRAVAREFAELDAEMAALRLLLAARIGVLGKDTLAMLIGVSPRTLEGWVRHHGLPVRKVGRVPVYVADEILSWLKCRPLRGATE